jgi:hypothetical protein
MDKQKLCACGGHIIPMPELTDEGWADIPTCDFCGGVDVASELARLRRVEQAARYYASVPCERTGNIHCTMIPEGSGLRMCGPCALRAALED